MYNNITGIILSGGKSSRMGENKAFLPLGEKVIIEHVADLMCSIFTNVILITNTPYEYEFLNFPVYEDIFKVDGPLAGIHSGLENSKTEENFILSCDMPLMESNIIKSIVEFKTDKPITICRVEGFIQHLAGRYSKSVSQFAEKLLQQEVENVKHNNEKHNVKVYSLLNEIGYETIEAEELPGYNPRIFFNMNNKEDYQEILSLF